MWPFLASFAHAGAFVGVDYVPFGRGDLAWVADEQTSGTLVSETDGLLQAPLTAWGGWASSRDALLFGLAVAQITTRSALADSTTLDHVGALRPSFDARHYLQAREAGDAVGFLQAGAFGVIPSSARSDDAFTEEEQAEAQADAQQRASRIGAIGVRAGGGAEVGWASGLTLGARYLFTVHRMRVDTDETFTTSTLVRGEAALTLGFML